MGSRMAVFGLTLWLLSSCGSSSDAGKVDGGSGGSTGSGGSIGSGGGSGSGGAGGAPSGTSGVTGSKALSTLTQAEKVKLCDWDASLWGGYNQTKVCPPDGEVSNDASQAECLAEFPSCAATVAQLETCSKKVISDPCDMAGILTSADCAPLLPCF